MTIRLTPVLVAAVLTATACRGQAPAPASTSARTTPAAAPAAGDPASPLVNYLPASGTPAGWTRSRPAQAYGPDNLWEFIDGAAETYVAFGFQEALSAAFDHAGVEVTVELYEMSDSLHAFGIYAQERPPAPQAVAVGDEGYANSNVLVFRKGACYAKLTSPKPEQPGPAALTALAVSIAGRIPAGTPLPASLAAFPARDQVPNSVKFLPKDVLGQRQLANGFEASYRHGASVSRLVVVPFASPKEATDAFARYRAFVAQGGKVSAAPRGGADEAFSGNDQFSGRVFAARGGPNMVISIGAPADAAAASLVSDYLKLAREQDKR